MPESERKAAREEDLATRLSELVDKLDEARLELLEIVEQERRKGDDGD